MQTHFDAFMALEIHPVQQIPNISGGLKPTIIRHQKKNPPVCYFYFHQLF